MTRAPTAVVVDRADAAEYGGVLLVVDCPHGRHRHTIALRDGAPAVTAYCSHTGRTYHAADPERAP